MCASDGGGGSRLADVLLAFGDGVCNIETSIWKTLAPCSCCGPTGLWPDHWFCAVSLCLYGLECMENGLSVRLFVCWNTETPLNNMNDHFEMSNRPTSNFPIR